MATDHDHRDQQTADEFWNLCGEKLNTFLHGNDIGIFKEVFEKIERNFQIPRLQVVLGFIFCLVALFLITDCGHFICSLIGFVYPAFVIASSLEQHHVQLDSKKWLLYWVIYNTSTFLEYFVYFNSHIWRYYWLIKCVILCLYFLPVSFDGLDNLYRLHIHPFIQDNRAAIKSFMEQVWESTNKGAPPMIIIFCAYMWGFRFLCNILGFVCPAYLSMVSLMDDEPEINRMCWMTYWLVYSLCSLLENVLSAVPLYYPAKFLLLGAYLLEPLSQKSLLHYFKGLILWYKPVSAAKRINRNIIRFFLAPQHTSQVVRVNHMERYFSGAPSLYNLAPRKDHITGVKEAHGIEVDPQEVNLQLSSPMVQAVLEMNVEEELIKKAIRLKLARDGPGQNFTSAEALLEAVFDLSSSSDKDEEGSSVDKPTYCSDFSNLFSSAPMSQVPLEIVEENRQLKEQRLCKICMTDEVGVVFVPCGHLVCCHKCAFELRICPICRAEIEASLRTYLS